MVIVELVGGYLIFFCMLYGYEKFVQRYDPELRLPAGFEVSELDAWNQVARKTNSRRKSHLKVVK